MLSRAAIPFLKQAENPVSYTHLDVYKRQAGGRDNVTIIVTDVVAGGIEMASLTDAQDDTDDMTLEITRPRSR